MRKAALTLFFVFLLANVFADGISISYPAENDLVPISDTLNFSFEALKKLSDCSAGLLCGENSEFETMIDLPKNSFEENEFYTVTEIDTKGFFGDCEIGIECDGVNEKGVIYQNFTITDEAVPDNTFEFVFPKEGQTVSKYDYIVPILAVGGDGYYAEAHEFWVNCEDKAPIRLGQEFLGNSWDIIFPGVLEPIEEELNAGVDCELISWIYGPQWNDDPAIQSNVTIMFDNDSPGKYPYQPVTVARYTETEISPGGTYGTLDYIFPHEEFTGLILTETIPEGIEINEDWGWVNSTDYTYNEETRELKFVLMNSTAIPKYDEAGFMADISQEIEPGSTIQFNGTWTILDSSGEIMGIQEAKVSGVPMPGCPISDQDLLGYIDQWAKMELSSNEIENDNWVMQILEVWKNC